MLRRPGFWEIILGLIGADAITKWLDRRRLRARELREMSLPKVGVLWMDVVPDSLTHSHTHSLTDSLDHALLSNRVSESSQPLSYVSAYYRIIHPPIK